MAILAFLILLGIIFIACKIVEYSHRRLGSHVQSSRALLFSRIALIIISCAVGILFAFIVWRPSETDVFYGFPLPYAAWELRNGNWLDFATPLSPLLIAIDFIIGAALIHLPVTCVFLAKRKKIAPLSQNQ
jgi:hypothetical protein